MSIKQTLATIRDLERRYLEARGQGKYAQAKLYLDTANSLAASIRY